MAVLRETLEEQRVRAQEAKDRERALEKRGGEGDVGAEKSPPG